MEQHLGDLGRTDADALLRGRDGVKGRGEGRGVRGDRFYSWSLKIGDARPHLRRDRDQFLGE